MKRLTAENLNEFIDSVSVTDPDKGFKLPRTATYPVQQYIDSEALIDRRDEFKDLFRQNLLVFSKKKTDLPMEFAYCTGERGDDGKFKKWTRNGDDVRRFISIAIFFRLITENALKKVTVNGIEKEASVLSVSEEEIQPAIVRESVNQAQANPPLNKESDGSIVSDSPESEISPPAMVKLTVENLNKYIDSVSGGNPDSGVELPTKETYPQPVCIDTDKLWQKREEFKDLFRQNLVAFSKKKQDLPLQFFYCTGEKNDNGSFIKWTNNGDDVDRFIFISIMTGLVTEIGEKTIEINGQKQNGFFATLSDEVIKPAVIRYNAHITAEEKHAAEVALHAAEKEAAAAIHEAKLKYYRILEEKAGLSDVFEKFRKDIDDIFDGKEVMTSEEIAQKMKEKWNLDIFFNSKS